MLCLFFVISLFWCLFFCYFLFFLRINIGIARLIDFSRAHKAAEDGSSNYALPENAGFKVRRFDVDSPVVILAVVATSAAAAGASAAAEVVLFSWLLSWTMMLWSNITRTLLCAARSHPFAGKTSSESCLVFSPAIARQVSGNANCCSFTNHP